MNVCKCNVPPSPPAPAPTPTPPAPAPIPPPIGTCVGPTTCTCQVCRSLVKLPRLPQRMVSAMRLLKASLPFECLLSLIPFALQYTVYCLSEAPLFSCRMASATATQAVTSPQSAHPQVHTLPASNNTDAENTCNLA